MATNNVKVNKTVNVIAILDLSRQPRYNYSDTLDTMNKILTIATVLTAAALAGIFSTLAHAQGDESETNTEQSIAQKNVGSGNSINNNCALNSIDSAAATVACTTGLPIKLPPIPDL